MRFDRILLIAWSEFPSQPTLHASISCFCIKDAQRMPTVFSCLSFLLVKHAAEPSTRILGLKSIYTSNENFHWYSHNQLSCLRKAPDVEDKTTLKCHLTFAFVTASPTPHPTVFTMRRPHCFVIKKDWRWRGDWVTTMHLAKRTWLRMKE